MLSVVVILTTFSINSYAVEDNSGKYEEHHNQINYKYSELVLADDEVEVVAKENGLIKEYLGNKE